jgi:glucose-specific phosphotransferase system IIA component
MTKKSMSAFSQLQKLGQSLMVPVSVLPGAGLIVAVGRMLQMASEQGKDVTNPIIHAIGQILFSSGLAIFENLPVVFAIGVAIGFSGGAGVAGLSAAAGYYTLASLLKAMSSIRGLALPINTGVFGGIIAGLLAAAVYRRYHETRLHPVLGFFSGKRLVPLVSMFAMVFVGLALSFVWPPIQQAISDFGNSVNASEFGPAFYAAGKRLLIPVGLHHVYYPSFLYEFGQFTTATGELLKGDSARYFGGDTTAGLFMASEFPIMLFGLPAAALAMVLRAKPERRKAISGIMMSAALTSIITGITEPIEFAFIFVAPALFVLHVILAFLSGVLTHSVDLHLGYTFSASLIDFVVGFYNQKNALQLWLFVGPVMAVLYFCGFYFLIPILGYKTPGREDEDIDFDTGDGKPADQANGISAPSDRIIKIVEALGGAANIASIDACITRLRLQLHDVKKISEPKLKALGAAGVMKASGGNVQVVFGTDSDRLKEQIKKMLAATAASEQPRGTMLRIGSPISGKIVPLESIPDPTFAQGIIGPGIGIVPSRGVVISPFAGKVSTIFHTNHAIGLESDTGIELLIHVGIDTVKMQGNGFKSSVKAGDKITKGQILIEFDLDLVSKQAKSVITPVIITNWESFKKIYPAKSAPVALQDLILEIER